MNADEITRALESGAAHRLGTLPGSPVSYQGGYWTESDDGGWTRVEDPETVTYLADAQRRLGLANRAADCEERS